MRRWPTNLLFDIDGWFAQACLCALGWGFAAFVEMSKELRLFFIICPIVLTILELKNILWVMKQEDRIIMRTFWGEQKGVVDLQRPIFWQELFLHTEGIRSAIHDEDKLYVLLSNEMFEAYPEWKNKVVDPQYSVQEICKDIEAFDGKQVLLCSGKLSPEDWEMINSWTEIHTVDPVFIPKDVPRRGVHAEEETQNICNPSQGLQ